MCPQETASLCNYQTNYQTSTTTYKGKPGLPAAIRELIRSIFTDLSNDDLLKIYLQKDNSRIQRMETKATHSSKQRRKHLSIVPKGFTDANKEWKGVIYGQK